MKRKIKGLISIILCLVLIIPNISVNGATKIRINKKSATIYVGKTTQLKIIGTKKKVKWKSSNKAVAIVTIKGKVKGLREGTSKITATVSKKKYTCKVTVNEVQNDEKILELFTTSPTNTPTVTGMSNSTITATLTPKVEVTGTPIITPEITDVPEVTKIPFPTITIPPTYEPIVNHPIDDNFKKLKTYIMNNGKEKSSEEKFIYGYLDNSTFEIIYDELFQKYTFIASGLTSNKNKFKLSLYIHDTNLENKEFEAKCEIIEADGILTEMYSNDCYLSDIGDEDKFFWKIIGDSKTPEEEFINMGREALYMAYIGWNELLGDNLSISIKDLGFMEITKPSVYVTASPTKTHQVTPIRTIIPKRTKSPIITPTIRPTVLPTIKPSATPAITPTVIPTEKVVPSEAPVVIPTETVAPMQNQIKKNFALLKEYIIQYGETNSSGNKFIKSSINDDEVYGILYDSENLKYTFTVYESFLTEYALSIDIYETNLNSGKIECIIIDFLGESARLNTNSQLKNINGNTFLNWIVDSTDNKTLSWESDANFYLDRGYAGWDNLLLETLDLHLSDLGFGEQDVLEQTQTPTPTEMSTTIPTTTEKPKTLEEKYDVLKEYFTKYNTKTDENIIYLSGSVEATKKYKRKKYTYNIAYNNETNDISVSVAYEYVKCNFNFNTLNSDEVNAEYYMLRWEPRYCGHEAITTFNASEYNADTTLSWQTTGTSLDEVYTPDNEDINKSFHEVYDIVNWIFVEDIGLSLEDLGFGTSVVESSK